MCKDPGYQVMKCYNINKDNPCVSTCEVAIKCPLNFEFLDANFLARARGEKPEFAQHFLFDTLLDEENMWCKCMSPQ